MLDECQGLYVCLVGVFFFNFFLFFFIALQIDKYVFGDNDAMLDAQMLGSVCVCVSRDSSVEHVFNEVKI